MRFLDRAASVETTLSVEVGCMRLFRRGKSPKSNPLPTNPNTALKLAANGIKAGAKQAFSSHRFAHVLQVLVPRYVTKVTKAVVVFQAIDVVNVLLRPFAMDMQPRKSVRVVAHSVNANGHVSRSILYSGSVADFASTSKPNTPMKTTGVAVVIKNFAQSLRGQFGVFHGCFA